MNEDLPCHSRPPEGEDDVVAYVEGGCGDNVKMLQRITKLFSALICQQHVNTCAFCVTPKDIWLQLEVEISNVYIAFPLFDLTQSTSTRRFIQSSTK